MLGYDRTAQTLNYVSKKDGPGCALDMGVKKDNCKSAANQLGFDAKEFIVIDNTDEITHAPSGCFVKKPISNLSPVYFNTMVPGETGDSRYLSICKSSEYQGTNL